MSEKFLAMRNEAVSLETASSLLEKKDSPTLKQLNNRRKHLETQRKTREKIENQEHEKADVDLDNEISSIEISSENKLNDFLIKKFPNNFKAWIQVINAIFRTVELS